MTTASPDAPGRCGYCGKPSSGDGARCSTGCSLAARVPVGSEGLPASWQLGVALGLAFVVFNQGLLASVAALAARKGEVAAAGGFSAASLAFGGVAALANLWLFLVARPKRWTDAVAWTAALGVGLAPALDADWLIWLEPRAALFAANALMACWLGRALIAGWLFKRPRKR